MSSSTSSEYTAPWDCGLRRAGKDNRPIANDYNACVAVRNSPQWCGRFKFETNSEVIEIDGRVLCDGDVYQALLFCQSQDIQVTKAQVSDAVEYVARQNPYSCFDELEVLHATRKAQKAV